MPPPTLHLEGSSAALTPSRWARCEVLIGRGRCRLRWFRLAGLPAAERLGALRLQVEAWRPFDQTDARLVLQGEQGLAVAWDGAALRRDLEAQGLAADRCHAVPEVLARLQADDGLHLLQLGEGFEAQYWRDGVLRASRWWPQALSADDWADFARASGASQSVAPAQMAQPPEPTQPVYAAQGWCKHQALHAGQGQDRRAEHRVVLGAAAVLVLAAGSMAQQLTSAWSEAQSLAAQVNELKQSGAGVVARRDAVLAQRAELEQMARWTSQPLPVEVLAHLAESVGRSGVQLKEFELEGERVRIALLPGPNTSRATLVKDLQAGGWFVDVNEARGSEASRNLLTFDLKLRGVLPPVVAAPAPTPAPQVPAPVAATPAAATAAPVSAPPIGATPVAPPPVAAARTPGPAPRAPAGPAKPIIAKPDAQGLPPPEVFDAIPNR